jgi:hypothetical protein
MLHTHAPVSLNRLRQTLENSIDAPKHTSRDSFEPSRFRTRGLATMSAAETFWSARVRTSAIVSRYNRGGGFFRAFAIFRLPQSNRCYGKQFYQNKTRKEQAPVAVKKANDLHASHSVLGLPCPANYESSGFAAPYIRLRRASSCSYWISLALASNLTGQSSNSDMRACSHHRTYDSLAQGSLEQSDSRNVQRVENEMGKNCDRRSSSGMKTEGEDQGDREQ